MTSTRPSPFNPPIDVEVLSSAGGLNPPEIQPITKPKSPVKKYGKYVLIIVLVMGVGFLMYQKHKLKKRKAATSKPKQQSPTRANIPMPSAPTAPPTASAATAATVEEVTPDDDEFFTSI